MCTSGALVIGKCFTLGPFLPLKPFSFGNNSDIKIVSLVLKYGFFQKNWISKPIFSQKITKSEHNWTISWNQKKDFKAVFMFLPGFKKTVQNQNYTTIRMKKLCTLHNFTITVLSYFWFWTVFLKPVFCLLLFLWNHLRFQQFFF